MPARARRLLSNGPESGSARDGYVKKTRNARASRTISSHGVILCQDLKHVPENDLPASLFFANTEEKRVLRMASRYSKVIESGGLQQSRHNTRLKGILVASLLFVWLVLRPIVQTAAAPDQTEELEDPTKHRPRLSLSLPSRLDKWSPFARTHETLILYAYHETDNAFENARFFIQHGLHSSADFVLIINGASPRLDPFLASASAPNVEVLRRDNTCFDLGAFGHVIEEKGILHKTAYQKFIMLNASVRGPFLPTWSTACWSTAWLSRISAITKLQGMTVNCVRGMHVQSMILGTDKAGLVSMYEDGSFTCADSIQTAWGQEVAITTKVLNRGWEVNAWMTALSGDPTYTPENRSHCAELGNADHLFEQGYFGFNIHPYETMFVKANRNIDGKMINKLTEWHNRMNYSSFDYC